MNTIIFQTIRAGIVLSVALFAFVGEVFAAPTLTPTEAVQIVETSATLVGYVENTNKTSIVWFEWSNNSSMSTLTTIGMTSVYSKGFFKGYLYNLKPDTVYYYRAVAMEGGTTVYSSVVSFRTAGGVTTSVATVVNQNTTTTNSSAPASTQAKTQTTSTQAKEKTTPVVVAKKTTSTTNTVTSTKEGFTNENTNVAAVIGAGGIFPRTLIGWIALLVALLVAILIVLMIYESSEKQKKARKVKRIQEEEEAEEKINDIEKILEKNR